MVAVPIIVSEAEVDDEARRRVVQPRPGHADLVGVLKYRRTDARDILERASARETTARVAAGAVAKRLLAELGVTIGSHIVMLGGIEARRPDELPDDLNAAADASPLRTLDPNAEARMIEEIDRVDPREGEEASLEEELRILENAEYLYQATAQLYETLYESDGAVHDQLASVVSALADLSRIDGKFTDSTSEIRSAQIAVSELATFLQDYNAGIEFNPERLEFIRDRLGAFELLKRKYGGSIEGVLAHRQKIGEEYALAADFAGAIARVEASIVEAEGGLSAIAGQLLERRQATAADIEDAIVAELSRLGITHARFHVQFDRDEDARGPIRLQDASGVERRYRAHARGAEQVVFHLSTNLGEAPRPLARVASGGEVSRVMLALKSVLARNARLPILVFDEIDTGVSGPIARKVGESMHDLARSHQIIAITHLPQIASMGDAHYVVEKQVDGARTRTTIRPLTGDERTAAVATLISGSEVSEAAMESARQLIYRP